MNRTRTLLVIGVFMLSLAVLAALEFRVQETAPGEGQMVTGSLSKDMSALPGLPASTESSGVLVPLDNGTLRGSSGSALDMANPSSNATAVSEKAPAVPSLSAVPEDPDSLSAPTEQQDTAVMEKAEKAQEKSPASERQVQVKESSGRESQPAPTKEKPRKEASKEAVAAPEKKGGLVLTTKAPTKLVAGQTAITATRLEIGKDIVFRATGAGPITRVKTLLLKNPDRYVVDLQGNWGIQIPRLPADLWIKDIRVGHHEDATRLVFELNRTPKSATAAKVNNSTVEVRIK